MHQVNIRGTFFTCQAALPYLKKAENPATYSFVAATDHEQRVQEPLRLHDEQVWHEYDGSGDGCNWRHGYCRKRPMAANNHRNGGYRIRSRWRGDDESQSDAEIMGDAAHWMLTKCRELTGQFLIDEDLLRAAGQPTLITIA